MDTETNFKTKKALKDAGAAGKPVRCYRPGPFPGPEPGKVTLEGPHFPEPHRGYAVAEWKDGAIVTVSGGEWR